MYSRFALAALAVALVACGDRSTTAPIHPVASDLSLSRAGTQAEGAVFVSTNSVIGNGVVAFARSSDGSLRYVDSYATGGLGIGGTADPLFSQFVLALDDEAQHLYVANAGSNDVTAFRVDGARLARIGTFASQGTRPVSVAVGERSVYVLNAGSNTIAGFRVGADGTLSPIPGSPWALGDGADGGAALRLTNGGRVLVVTERVSNTLETFSVGHDGALERRGSIASSGGGPFGFDVTPRGQAIVSEAGAGAASSYAIGRDGALQLVSGSVSTAGQAATCWLIVDRAGHFAYTANAGSGTITGYAIAANGTLTRLDESGITGDLGAGSQPLDLDLSRDSRFLYVLKNGTGTVGAFRVGSDGSLTTLADTPGLLASSGFMGVAAY